jgi:hypothetical protein
MKPLAVLPVTRRADPAMLGNGAFERVSGDRYYTEAWVTEALLDRVRFRGTIWEPACGRGDMVEVLRRYGYRVVASDIAGAELGCGGARAADFLTTPPLCTGEFSIVTNPPYTLAEQFIRAALRLTRAGGGMVAMIMRNEYDCAASRRDLFERRAFTTKLVLTRRPKWVDALAPHSASPRHNFAIYLWDHRHRGPARIAWLPSRQPDLLAQGARR